jgi:hypothetical protein
VAKDEIIAMDVAAEAEAVRQESLQDAARIEADLKEKVRKEAEKIYLSNLKRQEWAATAIQAGWRYHRNRVALRIRAQATYRKHWDRTYLEYYYEHGITRATVWEKPKSLGDYDVLPAPGWVAMHDNEGAQYYYNPQTWAMTWDQPAQTTLCEECGRDFAMARVSLDKVVRCEECFNRKALTLLTGGMQGDEIRFKPCNGGLEMTPVWSIIKERTWTQHCIDRDAGLRDTLESVEEEDKRKKDKLAVAALQLVVGEDGPVYCCDCSTALAELLCEICTTHFCRTCCAAKHSKSPWDKHQFTDLSTMTFGGGTGVPDAAARGGSRGGRRRRHRRSQSRSRSPSPSRSPNRPSSTGDDAAGEEARRARRRRRRKRRQADEEQAAAAAAYYDEGYSDVAAPPVAEGYWPHSGDTISP